MANKTSQPKVRSKTKSAEKRRTLKGKSQVNKTNAASVREKRRDVNTKFVSSTKALSDNIYGLGEVPNVFRGYKIPSGTVVDNRGRKWQIQAHAYISKRDIIKRDEVVVVTSPWAIGVRVKAFIQWLIEKTFS